MARKVQITKEIILQAALDMLIRDGYSSINIKTLAKEIGCSTQPLVWHFDNMEGLRTALSEYASDYANAKMSPTEQNGIDSFEQIGRAYVKIAVNEPNLFRFLYLNDNNKKENQFGSIVSSEKSRELIEQISFHLELAKENVGRYLQNTVIYAYGVATLVATNVIQASEEEMMEMINRAADAFILQEGLPKDKIPNGGGGR